jgi:hypothetical protein
LDDRVAALDDRVAALDDRVAALGDRVAALDDRVAALDDRVAYLVDRVAHLVDRVAALGDGMFRLRTSAPRSIMRARRAPGGPQRDGASVSFQEIKVARPPTPVLHIARGGQVRHGDERHVALERAR